MTDTYEPGWDATTECAGCGTTIPAKTERCGPCLADLTAPPASPDAVAAGLAAARALGKVYASRSCLCAGACWRAKCNRCGEVVSKHDFDAVGAWAALEQHEARAHPRSTEEVSN